MTRTLLITLVAVSALGASCAPRQPPHKVGPPTEAGPLPAPPAPAGPARTIPLDSCYATFMGSGCQFIMRGGDKPPAPELEELIRHQRSFYRDAFLVPGQDIAAAIKATPRAYTDTVQLDVPVPIDPNEGVAQPAWLHVNLGAGPSTPVTWQVHAVEVKGGSMRVVYSLWKPAGGGRRGGSTDDIKHYIVWVPLSGISPGTYALELYDSDRKELTLERRVTIAER